MDFLCTHVSVCTVQQKLIAQGGHFLFKQFFFTSILHSGLPMRHYNRSYIIQGPLNIWTEHSNCQKPLQLYWYPIFSWFFFMKLFFYAYKSWGHDPIWYFSCLCRKFSELRALLFLSSTQTSQNLKFIQKCLCLSSLKNKFQWTQNFFWPLIRKILIWTF